MQIDAAAMRRAADRRLAMLLRLQSLAGIGLGVALAIGAWTLNPWLVLAALTSGIAVSILPARLVWQALQHERQDVAQRATALEREVLERRRETDAAQRAKNEFVSSMSHELRTPLNAITLYADMLRESAEAQGRLAEVSELTKILSASAHLLELINSILDLSKIEAGRMELQLSTFGIRELVTDVTAAVDSAIRKNGNILTVTIDEGVGTMYADVAKTRQILYNLLSNAARFISRGVITVQVGCVAAASAGGGTGGAPVPTVTATGALSGPTGPGVSAIEFVVTDTGIGLSMEQQARIFRPFAQADVSIGHKYGGSGLGLMLVARYCALMGGEVRLQSAIGEGSRFTVQLPVHVTGRIPKPAAPIERAVSAA